MEINPTPSLDAVLLVIDDDILSLKLVSTALKAVGYKNIIIHHQAETALDLIDTISPDLLILDVCMPQLSGIDILASIRQSFSPLELPIIMYTACESTEVLAEALTGGANDYIVKPLNPIVAHARIQTQLSLKDLSKQAIRHKRDEAVRALIVTYNHEINNALTVATISIEQAWAKQDQNAYTHGKAALQRISEILKKIRQVPHQSHEIVPYCGRTSMFKI